MSNQNHATSSVAVEDINYYDKGQSDPYPRPGDFILTHGSGVYSHLIRFGQSLRFRGQDKKYAHFNHAALVVSSNGDLVEALNDGVKLTHLSRYLPKEYVVVRVEASDEDRAQMVKFALRCINRKYGWVHVISLALTVLFAGRVDFGVKNEMICSGLVARAQERGWAFFDNGSHTLPADLAKLYQAELIHEN